MFATLILTDEIRKIINSQLKKINTSWDLGLIDIAFNSDKVDVSQFEISEIERNKIMWEDIAKLSINLMLDYDYYKQFFFKSRYTEKEYSGRLLNLGLVFENDYWKSVCEPDIKDVQINIFMYLKYRIIFEKMHLNQDTGGFETKNDEFDASSTFFLSDSVNSIVDHCLICNTKILSQESQCSVCGLTIDDFDQPFIIKLKKSTNDWMNKETNIECGNSVKNLEEINIDTCLFCNNEMIDGDGNCNTCGATSEDIRVEFMRLNIVGNKSKSNSTRKYKNAQCDICGGRGKCLVVNTCEFGDSQSSNVEDRKNDHGYYGVQDGAQDGGERDLGNEDGGLLRNNDFMKEETNIKKWKCGGCGLLNEYSVMNCVVCFGLYKDGKWTCWRCNNENSGGDDLCGSCNERNANIAVIEGDNQDNTGGSGGTAHKQTHIPADEWRCTHTGCNTRQSYKHTVCQLCDSSRCVSGEWMCAKCKVINKCDNEKCHLCDAWNDYLPKKLCQHCTTNIIPLIEDRCEECAKNFNNQWRCGYSTCRRLNIIDHDYCSGCSFWRHNKYGRGDESKQQWLLGFVRSGWICYKCTTFNALSKIRCSKSDCNENRYAQI